MFVATLNFFLCRFLFLRYRGLDSGGYLSLQVDCLSDDGELVLFLLVPLEGPLSASFNLFEASCRSAKVSLLILLVGIGVPVVGVLKAVSLSTSRLLIPATRALSLTFMINQ